MAPPQTLLQGAHSTSPDLLAALIGPTCNGKKFRGEKKKLAENVENKK